MKKNKKILISCINSHKYGGFSYWSNFLRVFKNNSKKSKNNYFFLVNENSNFFKHIDIKNTFLVKNYIHKNVLLRFLYEQIYMPVFIFKKYNFNIFFNGKNIVPILIRKKSIVTIRNIEPFFYYKQKFSIRKFMNFLKFILTRISIKDCSKIISVSKNTKKIIRRYVSKKIIVIPNGALVSKKYKNKWSKNKCKNYILNVSKFIDYANQLKLVKIYKEAYSKNINLPPLYFAGDIYDKKYFNKIQKYIFKHRLKNKIKFLGYLSKDMLHSVMKNCKLFVFSSELESCPQTILEARLIGCPILSNNVEPMPEFIGKNGIYFDINDCKKSANILINTIYINKPKKSFIKKNDLKDYNWNKIILKYLKVFENNEK